MFRIVLCALNQASLFYNITENIDIVKLVYIRKIYIYNIMKNNVHSRYFLIIDSTIMLMESLVKKFC